MAWTDADIEELIARKDVYHVLTSYCRALDRCDVDMMRKVYWDDGVDDHGVFSGNAAEFADFIIREIQNWFEVTMHAIMNVHMEIEGDVACTESYLFAYHKVRGDKEKVEEIFGSRYMQQFDFDRQAGVPHHFYFGGRYIDRLERRNGEWRIKQRTVVMDWNDNHISGAIMDQGMFATLHPRGSRGPDDPVWANTP